MKTKRININEIRKIATNIPKTIKEAVDFNETELTDKDFGFDDEPMDEPMPMENIPMENAPEMDVKPMEDTPEIGGENGMAVVDKIRKMALRTMADLADNPEDPAYVILKKVWQMCDKKSEENKNNESL